MTNYQQISKLPLLIISKSLIFADRQACAFQTLTSACGDLWSLDTELKGDSLFPCESQGSLNFLKIQE